MRYVVCGVVLGFDYFTRFQTLYNLKDLNYVKDNGICHGYWVIGDFSCVDRR